jgi:fumarylacetoacetase
VVIGDMIFDLAAALAAGLFAGDAAAASGPVLNPLMTLGAGPRIALRRRLSALFAEGAPERAKIEGLAVPLLHEASACTIQLPPSIGNFTDSSPPSITSNGGIRRDPSNPLNPNYKYVPVAYHSRASSVRPSGVPVRRPHGQWRSPPRRLCASALAACRTGV